MQNRSTKPFTIAIGAAAAVVISGAMVLVMSRPASATVQFGKETGKTCGDCHTNAKGGGPLTVLGEKFKANGNKMPP